MTTDTIGLGFALLLSLLMGIGHLAAGRDPYRNFMTQLVFGWYEAHSPYEGEGLRRLLKISGIGYFAMAVVFAGVVVFRFIA